MPLPSSYAADCPFCRISSTYAPTRPPVPSASDIEADPLAHVILSTPLLVAFLDHAPISRGHVLLATRQHRTKLSDVSIEEGQAIGAWLGILSRAVVQAVHEPLERVRTHAGDSDVGDWNVVQNNGARAAQVVPHVHFHIIPRTSDVPDVRAKSWTIFGKGQREELDDEDAAVLLKLIRQSVGDELRALASREGDDVVKQLLGDNNTDFLKPKL